MIIAYVDTQVYARHGLDRVSAIIRGYKTIPRTFTELLFNLFTSGMQLRMYCSVMHAARLHLRFVVEFCMETHDAVVGRDRSEMLISRAQRMQLYVPLPVSENL